MCVSKDVCLPKHGLLGDVWQAGHGLCLSHSEMHAARSTAVSEVGDGPLRTPRPFHFTQKASTPP